MKKTTKILAIAGLLLGSLTFGSNIAAAHADRHSDRQMERHYDKGHGNKHRGKHYKKHHHHHNVDYRPVRYDREYDRRSVVYISAGGIVFSVEPNFIVAPSHDNHNHKRGSWSY
ncbi:MAG: hypothetical protein K9G26_08065 [Emcibacter sp.]|nr:hypothetical protein [Emcibacter sp.]